MSPRDWWEHNWPEGQSMCRGWFAPDWYWRPLDVMWEDAIIWVHQNTGDWWVWHPEPEKPKTVVTMWMADGSSITREY